MTGRLAFALMLGWVVPAGARAQAPSVVPAAHALADSLGLPDLRRPLPDSGDVELRLWEGWGLTGITLLRLRRMGGHWSAERYVIDRRQDWRPGPLPDSVDWAARWRQTVAAGLFELPRWPSRPLKDQERVIEDGTLWLVEAQRGGHYWLAEADNPELFCSADDRRLLAVVRALEGGSAGCAADEHREP